MIIRINDTIEFVLTPGDRPVIVVRDTSNLALEVCVDMTKQQAATLADAIQALAR